MTEAQEITIDLTARYDPRRNLKQMQFHSAPETYKLFGGAMGGGKTGALVNEGNQLNLDYPGNFGLIMRKTWPSFKDTVMPQLEKFVPRELVSDWNHSEKLITYRNLSRIRYGGIGDRPDDWQKFMSGEYGWIALDQAEEFTEQEFLMLATRLRLNLPDIKRYFLLSCNPTQGWIKKRFIESKLQDHIFIPSSAEDNILNLPSDYIPRMRSILPPKLQSIYLKGDWSAVGDPDDAFPYLEIKEAQSRHVEPTEPVEIGVDVARAGDDETTIFLREGFRVSLYSRARGHDLMRTVGLIWICVDEQIYPYWKGKIKEMTIKVDADGLGGGVVDRLKEQVAEKSKYYGFEIKVVEIHAMAKINDPVHFKNRRSEIYWGLAELLPHLSLPDDSDLASQLMAIKYRVNSGGQIEIDHKEDIKKRLGFSPDLAEGAIYCVVSMPDQTVRPGRVFFLGSKREPEAKADGEKEPEEPKGEPAAIPRPVFGQDQRRGRVFTLGRQTSKEKKP